jgi:hypothetical protein
MVHGVAAVAGAGGVGTDGGLHVDRGGCAECGVGGRQAHGRAAHCLSLPGRPTDDSLGRSPFGGIKQPLLLVYDTLVGCTDDGKISAESGIAERWEEAIDQLS